MDRGSLWLNRIGRSLIAVLFLGGAVQKLLAPAQVKEMIAGLGLPAELVWPVALFNLLAGVALIAGFHLRPLALVLAFYCMATSYFHFIPADGWQMSIFVKNWAIAGGLLILAAQPQARAAG